MVVKLHFMYIISRSKYQKILLKYAETVGTVGIERRELIKVSWDPRQGIYQLLR